MNNKISGWGNYPKLKTDELDVNDETGIIKLIKETSKTIIPRGEGKSYGDVACNDENITLTQIKRNRFLQFEEENAILTCESGVTLSEIIDIFLPKGYFLPVTPGTKHITLGGAIANDVHGKNHYKKGCISEFIISFELITAEGILIHCSREENEKIFWATIGGIGLTGIITKVKIKLMPVNSSYMKTTYKKTNNILEAIDFMEEWKEKSTYIVGWIDCLAKGNKLGRSVVMTGEHVEENKKIKLIKDQKLNIPFYFPGFILNTITAKLFNFFYYHKFKEREEIIDYQKYFYPLDSMKNWNKLYGKKGFIQYQVTIPKEHAKEGLSELLEKLSKNNVPSFLGVLKCFGKKNKGLFSFPFEGYNLALDIPVKNTNIFTLLDELDEIVVKYKGRAYLAKDARMKSEIFRKMYPEYNEFEKIKKEIDPKGKFSSTMSRRLEIDSYREVGK